MYAKIIEISTLAGTPMTYVLIHIWPSKEVCDKGSEPTGDNAFVMELVTTDARPVKDAQGRLKTFEGEFIHPDRAKGDENWELETFQVNVPAEIHANIVDYLKRRSRLAGTDNAFPDFHARPALVRDKTDPKSILARSDVEDMVGMEITVK